MGIPPAVMAQAVAVRGAGRKSEWQTASLDFLTAYWGSQPDDSGGFSRRITRAITGVAFEAYVADRAKARAFIREGWYQKSNASYPAYRNTIALSAAMGLSSIDYRDGLPPEGATLMRLLLTFYDMEGVVRPHLVLLNGLANIALHQSVTTEDLVLQPTTRKLKSLDDVLNDFKVLLGKLRADERTRGSVGGLQALLASISPRTGSRQRRIGLAELRNMVAHHDFALKGDGSAVIGFNTFRRAGKNERRLSSRTVDSNFDRLKGLDTVLVSWSSFLRIVAAT